MALPVQRQTASDDSKPAFRIREARRGDADALATLMSELGYPNAPDAATVHWVLSHPEIKVFVASDHLDKPVGMLTLSHRPQLRMKGRIATIDELVVAEPWRRKGVGRKLIQRAIELARSLSVKRMELNSHKGREQLPRAFYEACGFTEADSMVFRLGEIDFQKSR